MVPTAVHSGHADEREPKGRFVKRQAVERLLEWGYSPVDIAEHVGCSRRYIYALQRQRAAVDKDLSNR